MYMYLWGCLSVSWFCDSTAIAAIYVRCALSILSQASLLHIRLSFAKWSLFSSFPDSPLKKIAMFRFISYRQLQMCAMIGRPVYISNLLLIRW